MSMRASVCYCAHQDRVPEIGVRDKGRCLPLLARELVLGFSMVPVPSALLSLCCACTTRMSLEEIGDRVREARDRGATEVCMQVRAWRLSCNTLRLAGSQERWPA